MTGSRKVDRLLRNGLFLFVILMSLWMVFRSQVAGDQYRLLEPGWLPERVRELGIVEHATYNRRVSGGVDSGGGKSEDR